MKDKAGHRVTRDGIRIHSSADFEGMRVAGRLAAKLLDEVAEHVFVGQTTADIDAFIERRVTEEGVDIGMASPGTRS